MRRRLCAAMILTIGMAGNAFAEAPKEGVEADASTRQVSITSSFTGTEILVFEPQRRGWRRRSRSASRLKINRL